MKATPSQRRNPDEVRKQNTKKILWDKRIWGGFRKGAGRKPSPEFGRTKRVNITLYQWHVDRLHAIDRKLSVAIRKLIEKE